MWPALLLAALLPLGGCLDAQSLGDEPPDEVAVGDPPTWDNGIGELMQLKCGVCHRIPRPAVAPANTPDDLDLTVQFGTGGGVAGAADRLAEVHLQVGSGSMPLEYATPLTDAESTALQAWDGS